MKPENVYRYWVDDTRNFHNTQFVFADEFDSVVNALKRENANLREDRDFYRRALQLLHLSAQNSSTTTAMLQYEIYTYLHQRDKIYFQRDEKQPQKITLNLTITKDGVRIDT